MANPEMMLICKIIKEGKLKDVIDWGLQVQDFQIDETRTIYQQLVTSFRDFETSGTIIGPHTAKDMFPQLPFNEVDSDVTVSFLCKQLRNKRIGREVVSAAKLATEMVVNGQSQEAYEELQQCCSKIIRIDGGQTMDMDLGTGFSRFIDYYNKKEAGEIPDVVTWPWYPIQEKLGGIRKDDYIVLYGRPKSMKTWILMYMIFFSLMMQVSTKRILVYTKEMTADNLFQRLASIVGAEDYDNIRLAKLSASRKRVIFSAIADIMKQTNRLVVLSAQDAAGKDTVDWLRGKIEKYEPHIVFIDGIYLMTPSIPGLRKTNERVENVSRGIRQMVLQTGIPVIGTIQANRQAAGNERADLSDVAFSDAIGQDATAVIRVIKDKMEAADKALNNQTISLIPAAAREWSLDGFRVFGQPGGNFDFKEFLTEGQAISIVQSESEEVPKGGKKKKGSIETGNEKRTPVTRAVDAAVKKLKIPKGI